MHFSIDPISDCAVYQHSIFKSRAITYWSWKTFQFCSQKTYRFSLKGHFQLKGNIRLTEALIAAFIRKTKYLFPLIYLRYYHNVSVHHQHKGYSWLLQNKSFVLSSPTIFMKVFEMSQVNSHPTFNSRLIYKISIYGSNFKVHPLWFWYRGALLLGRKKKKNNRSLFLSSDNPLQSCGCQKLHLQDKGGERAADMMQLSPDRWMINKRQQLRRKHTPCKLK